MIRSTFFAAAVTFALCCGHAGAQGFSEAASADDAIILRMASAASAQGADPATMLAIASVIDDIRYFQVTGIPRPPAVGSAAASAVIPGVALHRVGGVYGLDARHWLAMVSAASGPHTTPVLTPAARTAVVALREDPVLAAAVASADVRIGAASFERSVGRRPSPGEVLGLHLYGPVGMSRYAKALAAAPKTRTDTLLRERGGSLVVLKDADGSPLTVSRFRLRMDEIMEIKLRGVIRFLSRFNV